MFSLVLFFPPPPSTWSLYVSWKKAKLCSVSLLFGKCASMGLLSISDSAGFLIHITTSLFTNTNYVQCILLIFLYAGNNYFSGCIQHMSSWTCDTNRILFRPWSPVPFVKWTLVGFSLQTDSCTYMYVQCNMWTELLQKGKKRQLTITCAYHADAIIPKVPAFLVICQELAWQSNGHSSLLLIFIVVQQHL